MPMIQIEVAPVGKYVTNAQWSDLFSSEIESEQDVQQESLNDVMTNLMAELNENLRTELTRLYLDSYIEQRIANAKDQFYDVNNLSRILKRFQHYYGSYDVPDEDVAQPLMVINQCDIEDVNYCSIETYTLSNSILASLNKGSKIIDIDNFIKNEIKCIASLFVYKLAAKAKSCPVIQAKYYADVSESKYATALAEMFKYNTKDTTSKQLHIKFFNLGNFAKQFVNAPDISGNKLEELEIFFSVLKNNFSQSSILNFFTYISSNSSVFVNKVEALKIFFSVFNDIRSHHNGSFFFESILDNNDLDNETFNFIIQKIKDIDLSSDDTEMRYEGIIDYLYYSIIATNKELSNAAIKESGGNENLIKFLTAQVDYNFRFALVAKAFINKLSVDDILKILYLGIEAYKFDLVFDAFHQRLEKNILILGNWFIFDFIDSANDNPEKIYQIVEKLNEIKLVPENDIKSEQMGYYLVGKQGMNLIYYIEQYIFNILTPYSCVVMNRGVAE